MNTVIESFARKEIRKGLRKLPQSHQRLFKLMYGRKNGNRTVEAAERLSITAVVNEVPVEKLDWALTQVQNSLEKEMRNA